MICVWPLCKSEISFFRILLLLLGKQLKTGSLAKVNKKRLLVIWDFFEVHCSKNKGQTKFFYWLLKLYFFDHVNKATSFWTKAHEITVQKGRLVHEKLKSLATSVLVSYLVMVAKTIVCTALVPIDRAHRDDSEMNLFDHSRKTKQFYQIVKQEFCERIGLWEPISKFQMDSLWHAATKTLIDLDFWEELESR